MADRVEHLRARAVEVRQLAEWATDPTIRNELLAIAAQYDGLANDIEGEAARAQTQAPRRAPIFVVTRIKTENPRRD